MHAYITSYLHSLVYDYLLYTSAMLTALPIVYYNYLASFVCQVFYINIQYTMCAYSYLIFCVTYNNIKFYVAWSALPTLQLPVSSLPH